MRVAQAPRVTTFVERIARMLSNLLMLAQDDGAVLTMRNGLLLLVIIGILVGYKIYKNKTMS